MADNQAQIEAEPEIDDFDADVRKAVGELQLESPEVRVEIDKPETRPRDESGKFIETDKAKPISQAAPKEAVQTAQTEQTPPAPAPVQAPKGLKPEFKAKFAELPPDWQAEINRREADAAKVLAAQDEERLMGKRVNEMAMPYLPTIRAEGATVEKAFGDYLQTAHVLRSGTDAQKAHAIAGVMQSFKVNPQVLFSVLQGANVVPGQQPPSAYDPRLDTLQQRLDQIERDRQAEIQQRQQQEQRSLLDISDKFASAPGHEHFDRLKPMIGYLLENDIAKGDTLEAALEDAYQRAAYSDPEIRSTLLAAQTQPGQRLTEQASRTARAKQAAVSVTGAPGSSRPLNGKGSVGSIEDDLRAAIAEHSGRV